LDTAREFGECGCLPLSVTGSLGDGLGGLGSELIGKDVQDFLLGRGSVVVGVVDILDIINNEALDASLNEVGTKTLDVILSELLGFEDFGNGR
jgi:hypothetical protein